MADKDKKQEIIDDIRRVAEELSSDRLSLSEYRAHGRYPTSTIKYNFGSWDRAVGTAGIQSRKGYIQTKQFTDEELLSEIRRLRDELGKPPSDREMCALGKFSTKPYKVRWGTFAKARDIALSGETNRIVEKSLATLMAPSPRQGKSLPSYPSSKGTAYGDFLNFRGLQHSPINEQGVVFLFGMVCAELSYKVEAVKTGFPDCEAKRKISGRKGHWERVSIEFEFQSRNFLEHGHDPKACDLIVCWEHNWPGCPLEVLELKTAIKQLPD